MYGITASLLSYVDTHVILQDYWLRIWLLLLLLFFFFSFIVKSDIQRGGEIETKIFHPMIYSLSDCNSWCYADPKPGSRNLFQVSHRGSGSQSLGPSWTAFPDHKQGAEWEVELPGLKLVPIWGPGQFKERTLATRPQCWALGYF